VIAVSLLLAAFALATLEAYWVGLGHRASVADTDVLWAMHRARVIGDPRAVVILGDSRSQLAFSVEAIEARLPDRPIAQLAIIGRPPLATLLDLASDPDFEGTAIVGLHAEHLENAYIPDLVEARVSFYGDAWREAAAWPYHDEEWRTWIGARLQERLVVLAPVLGLDRLARGWLENGALAAPPRVAQRATREMRGDYQGPEIAEHRRQFEALAAYRTRRPRPARGAWDRRAKAVRAAIREIDARGGQVVLVRLPSSPARFDSEEKVHPRVEYWDRLSEGTSAIGVHYRDVPALAGFVPPDSSHLDMRDASIFTERLLDEVERRGGLAD